ncbi:S-adenosyl-L-methionine-dependent methyltransferase [Aspergillus unguis]
MGDPQLSTGGASAHTTIISINSLLDGKREGLTRQGVSASLQKCWITGPRIDRTYHEYHKGKYMLPNDEEEQDRLDFLHHIFSKVIGIESPPKPPSSYENSRFLDLGCGTGIWAIELAQACPEAFVVGVDLSRIQPDEYPLNCEFYAPFDYEYPWELGRGTWDMIRLQMGCGSVISWPSLYRRIFVHLCPGGLYEQIELDFQPRCWDDEIDRDSPIYQWYRHLEEATAKSMRPISHSSNETLKGLQKAGFAQISYRKIDLPIHDWPADEFQKTIGRWYGKAFYDSIEPLALAAFSSILEWPQYKTQRIIAEVKQDIQSRTRLYHHMYIYHAQKRSDVSTDSEAGIRVYS